MADPKVGYSKGVYRLVQGTVDSDGYFSAANVPKEGFVSGIYKLTEVTVDASGDLSAASEDTGVKRSIFVTVDSDGALSVTSNSQEGYIPGVYRVTTSTNTPKEGLFSTFVTDIGTIVGGVWGASSATSSFLIDTDSGDFLIDTNSGDFLVDS
jgi:hypothetical protein